MPEPAVQRHPLVPRPSNGRWHSGRKLSHLIARDLRGMIVRGELAQGQGLPSETDLLGAFDVSRDTLREALRILESEALIEIRRGRGGGAVVQRPRSVSVTRYVSLLLQVRGATIGEIQEARIVLESRAAALLVESPTSAVVRLGELHATARSNVEDPQACVEALVAFEREAVGLAGNPTIAVVSGVFRDVVASHVHLASLEGRGPRILVGMIDGQGAYLDAVSAGEPAAMEAAWRAYLLGGAELLAAAGSDVPFVLAAPVSRLHASQDDQRGPSKMAATIAAAIRIRIAEGSLVAGDLLPALPELAATFGVSRPTIRECLRVLETEGLLHLRTGSRTGARVSAPTTEAAANLASILLAMAGTRMIDVLEARQLVEPSVMALVATRADADALTQLAGEVQTLQGLVDDTPAFVDQIGQVERQAFAAARNTAISIALEMIHWVNVRCRQDVLVRAVSTPKVLRTNRLVMRNVAAVVAAAERRDAAEAERLWFDHFASIFPSYRAMWGNRQIVDLFD